MRPHCQRTATVRLVDGVIEIIGGCRHIEGFDADLKPQYTPLVKAASA